MSDGLYAADGSYNVTVKGGTAGATSQPVSIDQTTPGTTNGVQLTAGTAKVGQVAIDQTTPGTTNHVQINENKATYVAVVTAYAGYATPTDLISIFGSATKTVKITKICMLVQSTAAAMQTIDIVKRSTANSGGTPTVATAVPYDSTSAAATAVVNTYAAAPTTGTLVGLLRTDARNSGTTTASATAMFDNTTLTSGSTGAVSNTQPVILRGVAQGVCINYRGNALTVGFVAQFIIEWTEE